MVGLHESKSSSNFFHYDWCPIRTLCLKLLLYVPADYVVIVSCFILVGLFSLQHYGTSRVAFMFAPIVTAWLLCISSIGIYNIFRWNPHIFYAISPIYMLKFLKTTGIEGWLSLGGVVLSIAGILSPLLMLMLMLILICHLYFPLS